MDVQYFVVLVLAGLVLAGWSGVFYNLRKYKRALAGYREQVRRLEDRDKFQGMAGDLMWGMLEAQNFEELREHLQALLPQFLPSKTWKIDVANQDASYFSVGSTNLEELNEFVESGLAHVHKVDIGHESVAFYLLDSPGEDDFRLEILGSEIWRGVTQIRNSFIDGLTGLWNQQYLLMRLAEEIQRARRYRHWVSLLMADADYFKQINDTYGHAVGDAAIREIANVLRKLHNRGSDVVARYGGDEFLVLLPETRRDKALLDAERTRAALSEIRIKTDTGEVSLSCSVGVYSALPSRYRTDAQKMMKATDQALYQAKASGRNCVVSLGAGAPM
jgi:diguanylate cyclase (GGDEF)-like protein